ncbi:MAG: hypothetical protein WB930_13850 [Syntrophobacteraceae bacterium]
MIGRTEGMLQKEVLSAAPIGAYTIATFGADDDHFQMASSGNQRLIGVFQYAVNAAEMRVRVAMDGISQVTISGSVNRGDWITSDENGCGITADPSPGEDMNVIGIAVNSGVAPHVVGVLVHPDTIQG